MLRMLECLSLMCLSALPALPTRPYRIEACKAGWRDRALIATRKIEAGEVVLAEKPLIAFDTVQRAEIRAKVVTIAATLSPKDLMLLDSLPISPAEAKFTQNIREAAVCSNLAPMEVTSDPAKAGTPAARQKVGLFPESCLLTESCGPNTWALYQAQLGMMVVHAMRDIEKGEVITFSRAPSFATAAQRGAKLSASCGIEKCTCSLCSRSPSELATSDARRLEMRRIRDSTATTEDPWTQLNLVRWLSVDSCIDSSLTRRLPSLLSTLATLRITARHCLPSRTGRGAATPHSRLLRRARISAGLRHWAAWTRKSMGTALLRLLPYRLWALRLHQSLPLRDTCEEA